MLKEEFERMTGFRPTPEEYEKIEIAYYDFAGDKEAFCREWIHKEAQRTVDARARKIELLENNILEQQKEATRREKEATRREKEATLQLQALKDKVERLEGWKPCSGGTNMEQKDYLALQKGQGAISVEKAREIISREFGFVPKRIAIKRDVATYEANRNGKMRIAEKYTREPIYSATDWNYIRFDIGGYQWEMVNGELKEYMD